MKSNAAAMHAHSKGCHQCHKAWGPGGSKWDACAEGKKVVDRSVRELEKEIRDGDREEREA